MEKRSFREDLYYRLAVVKLNLPPLRNRRTDIPLLAIHFVDLFNKEYSTRIKGISPQAMELLVQNHWPGNVRELRNVIEATLAIEGDGEQIGADSLSRLMDVGAGSDSSDFAESFDGSYSDALAYFEHRYFVKLLSRASGNVDKAARLAELNIATLYRKIKKYHLR
jgi:two-component system response regulator AtoC